MCTFSMQNLCPSVQTDAKPKARKTTAVKPKSGPNIKIAIEDMAALSFRKEEVASPFLNTASGLTPEMESKCLVNVSLPIEVH